MKPIHIEKIDGLTIEIHIDEDPLNRLHRPSVDALTTKRSEDDMHAVKLETNNRTTQQELAELCAAHELTDAVLGRLIADIAQGASSAAQTNRNMTILLNKAYASLPRGTKARVERLCSEIFAKVSARRALRMEMATTSRQELRQRFEARVRGIAKAELYAANYRRSESRWAGGDHIVKVEVKHSMYGIEGSSSRVWSKNGKWSGNNSQISATVDWQWFGRVYKRGLSLIDGQFVLNAYETKVPGVLMVRYGKQSRGFSIALEVGYAKQDEFGKWRFIRKPKNI